MMMELGSVLLLTLVSLVSASPHGYGVKGGSGAVAKAEASATAGAFSGLGAVPVAFPAPVGGYSGSYSKSSSSSFASSSASASSESFAFSGGSAGGFPSAGTGSSLPIFGDNGSGGKAECGKSGCSGVGLNNQATSGNGLQSGASGNGLQSGTSGNGLQSGTSGNGLQSGTSGSGIQSYSGANAVAGSGVVIGLPSFTTYEASQPCLSGDCTQQTTYENKCSSGHCGTSLSTSSLATGLGSNDQNLGNNKDTSNNFYSNCAYGNCGTNPKTTNYEYYNQKPICNSPGCSNSNTYKSASDNAASVVSNSLQVPASYLTTPNSGSSLDGIECAGASCQNNVYDMNIENNQNLPSSYNVPSYTVTASDLETPKCYSGNCDSRKSQNSYNPSAYYDTKPDTITYSSETKCTSPNCAESAEDIKVSKSYSVNTQRPVSFGCETGNCDTYLSGNKPSFTNNDVNINNCGTSNCGKPAYPAYEPNYSTTAVPFYTSAVSDSASNVYAFSDSTSSLNMIHATNNNNYFKPTSQNMDDLSSTVLPTYTQPSKIDTYIVPSSGTSHNIPTNGNIFSSPGSGLSYIAPSASYSPSSIPPTKGSTYHNSFSHGNTFNTAPESSGSYYSPTISSNSITVPKDISHSAPLSNSYYTTTPSSLVHVSPSIIPTSYAPSSISSGYTPSSALFNPASNSPSHKLPTSSTGHTYSNTGSVATSGSIPESHTHITSLPSSSVSHKPAVYTGSFGGPPGLLNPNDYSVPQKPASAQQRPFVQQPYSTTTTLLPSKPTEKDALPCSSSNCEHSSGYNGHAGSSSDAHSKSIAYTGGFGGSPGLLSPFSSVNTQTPLPSTKPSVAHADASASSNAVVYHGGFGGPPGILKPYDSNNVGSSLTDQSSTHYSNVPKGISNTPNIGVLTGTSAQSGAPAGGNIGGLSQTSSHQPLSGSCTGTKCSLEYESGNNNQAYSPDGAFASGTALANAIAGSGSQPSSGHDYSSDSKHATRCNSGCGVNHDSGYGGYGLSNSGSYSTSLGGGYDVAGAAAKSFASAAGSGGGSYGGSFASSSAHASAGAGTKGGYGRR